MFYSDTILSRKGPLATVWLACHWDARKLTRPVIQSTNLLALLASLEQLPATSLRLKGQLLLGLVRIYDRKIRYLLDDLLGFKDQIRLSELEATVRRTHAQASDELEAAAHLEHGSAHKRARLDLITFPAMNATDPSLALALLENKIAMSPNPHQMAQTMAQSPMPLSNAIAAMHQGALTAFEPDMEALGWPSEWDIHYDDLLGAEQPRRDMSQDLNGMRQMEEEEIEVPRRAPTLDPLDMVVNAPLTPTKPSIDMAESDFHDGPGNDGPVLENADLMALLENTNLDLQDSDAMRIEGESRFRDSLDGHETDRGTDTHRRTSARLAATAASMSASLAPDSTNKKPASAHHAKPHPARLAVDNWIELPGALIQSQLKDTSDITKPLGQSRYLGSDASWLLQAHCNSDDDQMLIRILTSHKRLMVPRRRQLLSLVQENDASAAMGASSSVLEPSMDRILLNESDRNDAMAMPPEASLWQDWADATPMPSRQLQEDVLPMQPSSPGSAVVPLLASPSATSMDAARTPDLMALLSEEAEARVSFSGLLRSTIASTDATGAKRIASALFFQILTACSRGQLRVEQSLPFADVALIKVG